MKMRSGRITLWVGKLWDSNRNSTPTMTNWWSREGTKRL
jgi:hypothetical protein